MSYKITLVRFATDVNFDSTGTREWGADLSSHLGYAVEDKGSYLVFTPLRPSPNISRFRVPMWNVAQINEKDEGPAAKDEKPAKGGKADAS